MGPQFPPPCVMGDESIMVRCVVVGPSRLRGSRTSHFVTFRSVPTTIMTYITSAISFL